MILPGLHLSHRRGEIHGLVNVLTWMRHSPADHLWPVCDFLFAITLVKQYILLFGFVFHLLFHVIEATHVGRNRQHAIRVIRSLSRPTDELSSGVEGTGSFLAQALYKDSRVWLEYVRG